MMGRKHDATGRSTGAFATARFRITNRPPQGEPFVWLTLAQLESPTYRTLSLGARKVIDRIAIEHMRHGGGRNGDLVVTYDDFEAYGIRRRSIRQYLEEAAALGFIARTQRGAAVWGEFQGLPARYRLTWLPTCDGRPATNDWARFQNNEEAEAAVHSVRRQISNQRNEKRLGTQPSAKFACEEGYADAANS